MLRGAHQIKTEGLVRERGLQRERTRTCEGKVLSSVGRSAPNLNSRVGVGQWTSKEREEDF